MTQEEKSICPACGKSVKVGSNFCTNCGVELSEFDMGETSSGTIIKGWEVPPNRIKLYVKMMAKYPLQNPLITSRCLLDKEEGLLIINDYGIAWNIYRGLAYWGADYVKYTRAWIRWYDVADIILTKPNQVRVLMKRRKKGLLRLYIKGYIKMKKLKLTINKSKGETQPQFKQRLETYNTIMLEIFYCNRVEVDPPESDSELK